ncbi:Hypothetical protein NTJ_09130 [Nesidiocoris tenuis]|nr:Hypothetical protein NTJ_09130 [Nesidiocoris tenuis]
MAISLLLSMAIFENSVVSAHLYCYVCGASKSKLKTGSFYDDLGNPNYADYPGEPVNSSEAPFYPDEFDTVDGNVV